MTEQRSILVSSFPPMLLSRLKPHHGIPCRVQIQGERNQRSLPDIPLTRKGGTTREVRAEQIPPQSWYHGIFQQVSWVRAAWSWSSLPVSSFPKGAILAYSTGAPSAPFSLGGGDHDTSLLNQRTYYGNSTQIHLARRT